MSSSYLLPARLLRAEKDKLERQCPQCRRHEGDGPPTHSPINVDVGSRSTIYFPLRSAFLLRSARVLVDRRVLVKLCRRDEACVGWFRAPGLEVLEFKSRRQLQDEFARDPAGQMHMPAYEPVSPFQLRRTARGSSVFYSWRSGRIVAAIPGRRQSAARRRHVRVGETLSRSRKSPRKFQSPRSGPESAVCVSGFGIMRERAAFRRSTISIGPPCDPDSSNAPRMPCH